MTPLGIVVVLVALTTALWAPRHLVTLLMMTAVLEGGAVLVAGSFALTPYYFVTILVMLRLMLLLARRAVRFPKVGWLLAHLALLILFAVTATGLTLVLPHLFRGLAVYAPRGGLDAQIGAGTPLAFGISNIAQVGYLWLNIGVVVYIAGTARHPETVHRYVHSFLWSGLFVVAIGLYQALAETLGLPFPYQFLLNNTLRSLRYGITFSGVPRITATFTEASNLAVFATPFLAFAMIRFLMLRRRVWANLALTAAVLVVLLLSTSSAAYLGIAGLGLAMITALVLVPILQRGSFGRRIGLSLAAASLLTLGAVAALPELQRVIAAATLDKGSSNSFQVRRQADIDAVRLLPRTSFLGVGLGSNRPSSFVTGLLSTTGVLGLTLFIGAVLTLLLAMRRSRLPTPLVASVRWALLTLLALKALASPDLSTPVLWVLWGLCLAVAKHPRGQRVSNRSARLAADGASA